MKYHKLVENAAKPEGFWVDVGCGGGRTVSKLCDRVGSGKVIGVDYSELCIRKSESSNHKQVLCGKAEFRQASVSQLPFESGSFDLVTAVETYYFWPDKLNDLLEVQRVMRHGGKLLLVFEMRRTADDPDRWKPVGRNKLAVRHRREGVIR